MAKELVFDVRFLNDAQQGVAVDSDLVLELWAYGAVSATESRVIGTDIRASLVETTDSNGVFYVTVADVSTFAVGPVVAKWYAKQSGSNLDPYPFTETLSYPLDDSLSASTLKTYVFTALGFPAVLVELQDSHVNAAIDDCMAYYNAHVGRMNTLSVTLVPGQNAYPLPAVGSRGVAHVQFTRQTGAPLISDPLFGREYPRGSQLDWDQYQMGLSHWESMNRTTGMEPDWVWDQPNRTLFINIGQRDQGFVGMGYNVTAYHYESIPLEQVPVSHRTYIKRYVLAGCKEILGRIRGKFGGQIPSPGGGVTMDSQALLEEAQREKEALEEQIRGLQEPVPMSIG